MRLVAAVLALFLVSCHSRPRQKVATESIAGTEDITARPVARAGATNIYVHNLLLRKGPNFKARVRWLRGVIEPVNRSITPSLDDTKSFSIRIQSGVVRASLSDLTTYFAANPITNTSVKDLKFTGQHNQIRLNATYHKVLPFPIEVIGDVAAAPADRIRIHVVKLDVLKVPLKGLLSRFHVKTADLFDPKGMNGVQVSGDDIYLDTSRILPPPHLTGQLTKIQVDQGDIVETFGDAQQDVARAEQWRNFLRLRGGSIEIGKLTMHQVDLIMVDTSADEWFDLDLDHYQEQMVYGYTRMTPQAGLQIFMPDVSVIPRSTQAQQISMEWLKHRNIAPPADVISNEHLK